jgi:hypothetical protein
MARTWSILHGKTNYLRSRPQVAIIVPAGDHATDLTSFSWPSKVATSSQAASCLDTASTMIEKLAFRSAMACALTAFLKLDHGSWHMLCKLPHHIC